MLGAELGHGSVDLRHLGRATGGGLTCRVGRWRQLGGHAHELVVGRARERVGLRGLQDVVPLPLRLAQVRRLPPAQPLLQQLAQLSSALLSGLQQPCFLRLHHPAPAVVGLVTLGGKIVRCP